MSGNSPLDQDGGGRLQASCEADRALLRAIGTGARTFQVARRVGLTTERARRALFRLQQEGLVALDLPRCASNDHRWICVAASPDQTGAA